MFIYKFVALDAQYILLFVVTLEIYVESLQKYVFNNMEIGESRGSRVA